MRSGAVIGAILGFSVVTLVMIFLMLAGMGMGPPSRMDASDYAGAALVVALYGSCGAMVGGLLGATIGMGVDFVRLPSSNRQISKRRRRVIAALYLITLGIAGFIYGNLYLVGFATLIGSIGFLVGIVILVAQTGVFSENENR
jgi:hypothetical protein